MNALDINKEAPLHIAARLGHEKIIRVLIENGAEIESRNRENKTPTFLSVLSGKDMSKKTCSMKVSTV